MVWVAAKQIPGIEAIVSYPERRQQEHAGSGEPKAGVPDLCLPVARNGFHGLYIEMKYGKNKTTDNQKEWLKALTDQGYYTVVCYGAEEAERIIARYLQFPGYPAIEEGGQQA